MTMINLGNNVRLPIEVVTAYEKSENNILCSIYEKSDNNLGVREIRTTQFDLNLLTKMIENGNWDGGQFIIIDKYGNPIYMSNNCNIVMDTDENGYIFATSIDKEIVLHPFSDGFLHGNSIEEVNSRYKRFVEIGFYTFDENFVDGQFVEKSKINCI